MSKWNSKNRKIAIHRLNDRILSVVEKDSLEKLQAYSDRFPFLSLRKAIKKVFIYIHMIAKAIISTKTFENLSILTILLNSVIMTFDDYTDQNNPSRFFVISENVFLALYSAEMILKILGMGFIFGPNAYLKESWNVLDFLIVISSYPSLFQSHNPDSELNIGSMRAFRVLRPLKTISSIKGLKVLMNALISAINLLRDTLIILQFFALIYAITGTQLLRGELKQRCVSIQTGVKHPDDILCGGTSSCPGGYFCGKTNENPNSGVTNFDNVMYSFLIVIQTITLEGWSDIQVMLQRSCHFLNFLFFVPLVFVGAFFLLNLTLAVINTKFTEAHKEKAQDESSSVLSMILKDDQMPLEQFLLAKKYARKMIQFLRLRQEIKRIEEQKQNKLDKIIMPTIRKMSLQMNSKQSINTQKDPTSIVPKISSQQITANFEDQVIIEDQAESTESLQNGINLNEQIQNFIRMNMDPDDFNRIQELSSVTKKSKQNKRKNLTKNGLLDIHPITTTVHFNSNNQSQNLSIRDELDLAEQSEKQNRNEQHTEISLSLDSNQEQRWSRYSPKNISKTFKNIIHQGLAQNQQTSNEEMQNNEEIENKFRKIVKFKNFQEDISQSINTIMLTSIETKESVNKGTINEQQIYRVPNKELRSMKIQPIESFLKCIDPSQQKIQISRDTQYVSSSQAEILNERIEIQKVNDALKNNHYIKIDEEQDDQIIQRIDQNYEPYQMKVHYQVYPDSSDLEKHSSLSDDEDHLVYENQPYESVTNYGYEQMLTQLNLKQIAKRSDITLTSTIAMNLHPKDTRKIKSIARVNLTKQQLDEYISQRDKFEAISKFSFEEIKHMQEKKFEIKTSLQKSLLFKSQYSSDTMLTFQKNLILLNRNKKEVKEKSQEILKQEKRKFEQNKRASEKISIPIFDLNNVQSLLRGKYHDQENNINDHESEDLSLTINQKNKDDIGIKEQFHQFGSKIKEILDQHEAKQQDEIPKDIREQFCLPKEMGQYQVNFERIRASDFSKKKQKPYWSGQDVLENKIDHQKSLKVIQNINANRIWPSGFAGILKRIKFVLRIFVRSSSFDSVMTFFVLLNAITLSLDKYGIEEEMKNFLNVSDEYFTNIFFFEMIIKLIAIGFNKYCSDRMNLLDGTVVMLSVFEKVSVIILSSGGGNLNAFKTVRMLRTFRVFRIARILRSLESMQTILGVMTRSYKSFIYITLLMFIFVFIFMLLGMNIYGGKFGNGTETPRGNFDTPMIAFITVFQILTMENWQSVMFDSMSCSVNKYQTALYYFSWIFIGNFILLNLFLAILLDSFLEEENDDEEDEEFLQNMRLKRAKQIKKRKIQEKKKITMRRLPDCKIQEINRYFQDSKSDSNEDIEDLDEEQVFKIFQEAGIIQKDQSEEKKNQLKLFENISCASSLYVFNQQNKFRIFCYKSIKHAKWESLVQLLIGLSSLKLAIDTYYISLPEQHDIIKISNKIDVYFNIIFIIEMMFKIIAQGLFMDHGSFMRDSWNLLDFFIVVSSIADMTLAGLDISAIKILRMLRALRPLRFLSHNVELKLIVVALMESVGHIFNVLIVVAVVYLIFAIIGVSLFSGKFFYCSIDLYQIKTERECNIAGGHWKVWDHNFDNVLEAMITLYVVSSLEGWPDIMHQALDTTDVDQGPIKENNQASSLFFVLFILIGSFFFLNFFIGVLFLKFNQAQIEEKKGYTDKDLAWKDIQKLILQAQPEFESTNVPKNRYRKYFHSLVISSRFDNFIMIMIVLNMLQMAISYEGMSQGLHNFIDVSEQVFTFIFLIEAVFKIIAFGKTYFDNLTNKFDFFVVTTSVLDVVFEKLQDYMLKTHDNNFLGSAPQIAKIFRILRITRVVRLAGKDEGLQAIIQTIMFSIPSLANVIILLMLVYFMFSILGNFMFYSVTKGEAINELKNFQTFQTSFLLLFAISTGEDWNKFMFDCSRTEADGCIQGETCGLPPYSYWFFMIMVLICSHIMLNLFILVIIQQFEQYYIPKDNAINKFKYDCESFMKVWKKYTFKKHKCKRIKEEQLTNFFKELGEYGDIESSLGFGESYYDDREVKKELLKMSIKSYNGYVYFNELLYRCMRRKYGSMKINKKMQIYELHTQYKIYQLYLNQQNMQNKLTKDQIYDQLINKKNGVNPFLTVMYFNISFRTWLKNARIKLQGLSPEDINNDLIKIEIDKESYYSVTSDEERKIIKQKAFREQRSVSKIEIKNEQSKNILNLLEQKLLLKLKSNPV